MKDYDKILNLFTSNNSTEIRQWHCKPFLIGNKLIATDGYSLVSFNKSNIEFVDNIPTYTKEKLNGVYPLEHHMKQTISIDLLKKCFEKIPLADSFKTTTTNLDCDECEGDGEVVFSYSDNNYKRHELKGDCPICDGCGQIVKTTKESTGKKVIDTNYFGSIGNSVFKIDKLQKIIEVAEILNEDSFDLVHQKKEFSPSLFLIKDVEILLAPNMLEGEVTHKFISFNIPIQNN